MRLSACSRPLSSVGFLSANFLSGCGGSDAVAVARRLFTSALATFLFAAAPALADITGPARVIDGDTLHVQGVRIRLSDIDAPERRQTCKRASGEFKCGLRATAVLTDIIGGRDVRCVERGRDRYRRVLAVCFVGRLDIGGELVRRGWALAYRRYGLTYVSQEAEARSVRRGLWGSRFTPPWKWRRMMR